MKTLSIVIPVYNEEKRVSSSFRAVINFRNNRHICVEKFIFVNDGSTDSTAALIRGFIKRFQGRLACGAKVELISFKQNRGRGYAIKKGLRKVRTDYALYVDSDLSIPLSNLSRFYKGIKLGSDLLIGSKKKPGSVARPQRSLLRQVVGYGHTLVATMLLGPYAWDYQGGFKMFSQKFIREVMPFTSQERWGLDMEVVFLAKKLNYDFDEVPVVWRSVDEGSTVKLGRDIRRALSDMLAIRKAWSYKTYAGVVSSFNLRKISIQ